MGRDPNTLAMLLRRASPRDLATLAGRAGDLRDHGYLKAGTIWAGRSLAGIGRGAAPTALRIGTQATGTNEIPTITVRPER